MSRAPIWARPGPGERRPRYTREQIAAKALEIADAEGFDAVSMRRVARELGAGTMTLYHYVATKDDLIELMDDQVMAEVVIPDDEMPARWREALAEIARRSVAAYARHPWAFESLRGVRIGPNGLRHFEQSLAAVDDLQLSMDDRFELLTLVDDYTYGYVARWTVDDTPEPDAVATLAYLRDQLGADAFPRVSELLDASDPEASWKRVRKIAYDPERFERGLQRLLDGVEADLKRRGRAPRGRSRGPRGR